jgi:hypothetical protein
MFMLGAELENAAGQLHKDRFSNYHYFKTLYEKR